jgi:hypothetical protein
MTNKSFVASRDLIWDTSQLFSAVLEDLLAVSLALQPEPMW